MRMVLYRCLARVCLMTLAVVCHGDDPVEPHSPFVAPIAQMPDRLFTPAVLAAAREEIGRQQRFPFFAASQFGNVARADTWTSITAEGWSQIIANHAPFALADGGRTCPFCGDALRSVRVNLAQPLQGTTVCCGAVIYADESQMPADYPARPNHREEILHPDGRTHAYAFYVPDGAMNERDRWFCPAGELWRARMRTLLLQVIPDLSTRLIVEPGDHAAANALLAIFDRLADVYPGLPFYDYRSPLGIEVLSADEQAERQRSWESPGFPWDGENGRLMKLYDSTSYGAAGRLRHCSTLAEAWDLVRHLPVSQAYSEARYGAAAAFDERVTERLFRPMNAWARRVTPGTGNMQMYWFMGAMKIAIVTQDQEHLDKAAFWYESYLRNHFFSDGLSVETAFNYSAMLGFLFYTPWISTELLGIDFDATYPLMARIRELGDYPVVTLAQVESMHADEHAQFFTSRTQPPPGKRLDYDAHSRSQNFPDYGLTCLRAGAPGSRLELIMDYQNAVLHAHRAALNLQLFYQGVNLLPDIGYNHLDANPDDERWAPLKESWDLIAKTNFANDVEGHNTGTALGSQFGHNSVAFERYLGLPESPVQLVQAEGKWLYQTNRWPDDADIPPVRLFNRQVATVTLPNGRALALDFFRMDGGWRHDVFWHAPAEATTSSMGAPTQMTEPNLLDVYRQSAMPPPGWMKENTYQYHYWVNVAKRPYFEGLRCISDPVTWEPTDSPWWIKWEVDPSRYAPVTPRARALYEPWSYWLRPVSLRIWGDMSGEGAEREAVYAGGAPWASHVEMGVYGGRSRLTLKDGFQALVEHRQGASADIASTFVHVLEPSAEGQAPVVQALKVAAGTGDAEFGTIVEMAIDGAGPLFVASSVAGGQLEGHGIRTDARLAVAMPRTGLITLFDGSELSAPSLSVVAAPTPRLTLVGVIGDLTGQPQESALIVESAEPLPTGSVLGGQTLTVEHQTSGAHASAYEIDAIQALGEGRYRIDLRHAPPFIRRKLFITSVGQFAGVEDGYSLVPTDAVPPANRHRPPPIETAMPNVRAQHVVPRAEPGDYYLGITHKLHDGISRPNAIGRRILLPRSGFESTIKGQQIGGYAGWWSVGLVPAETPGAGDVAVGDPLLIYSIAPGDTVVIPTLVSCQPVAIADGKVRCQVYATSPASLTIAGQQYQLRPGHQEIHFTPNHEDAAMIRQLFVAGAVAAATATSAIAEPPPAPVIANHFSFDNDDGRHTKDATANSEPAWIPNGENVSYIDGPVGKAIQLDGTAVISVWKSKFVLKSGASMSFWIKPDTPTGGASHRYGPGLFSLHAVGAYDNFISLATAAGGGDQLVLEDAAGKSLVFDVPALQQGKWRHFAIAVDAKGVVSLYQDGKLIGAKLSESGAAFALPINVIGAGYGKDDGSLFIGAFDEVIFFNKVLDKDEVAELATATGTD